MTISDALVKIKDVLKRIFANKYLRYVFLGLVALCGLYFLFTGSGRDITYRIFRDQINAHSATIQATYEAQIKALGLELQARNKELAASHKRVEMLNEKLSGLMERRRNIKPPATGQELVKRFREIGYDVTVR